MQETLAHASGAGADWPRCNSAGFFLAVAVVQHAHRPRQRSRKTLVAEVGAERPTSGGVGGRSCEPKSSSGSNGLFYLGVWPPVSRDFPLGKIHQRAAGLESERFEV